MFSPKKEKEAALGKEEQERRRQAEAEVRRQEAERARLQKEADAAEALRKADEARRKADEARRKAQADADAAEAHRRKEEEDEWARRQAETARLQQEEAEVRRQEAERARLQQEEAERTRRLQQDETRRAQLNARPEPVVPPPGTGAECGEKAGTRAALLQYLDASAADKLLDGIEKHDAAAVVDRFVELARALQTQQSFVDVLKTAQTGRSLAVTDTAELKRLLDQSAANAQVPTIKLFAEGKTGHAAIRTRYPQDLFRWQEHTQPLPADHLKWFTGQLGGDLPYRTYEISGGLTVKAYSKNITSIEALAAAKASGLKEATSAFQRYTSMVTGCNDDPNEMDEQEDAIAEALG